jgi:SPP1 family predicted phage head-tail adaptor
MRAGALDRIIIIERQLGTGLDDAGTPVSVGWMPFVTSRAQLIEASTDEYLRGYGEGENGKAIFRLRWVDGVTADMRVIWEGRTLNIREIKQIGRNRGLELRCEEVRT